MHLQISNFLFNPLNAGIISEMFMKLLIIGLSGFNQNSHFVSL